LYHVKPGKLNVIQYTGGEGGEFLCHWLGLNSNNKNPYTKFLLNNRFIMPSLYNAKWQIDNAGSDQLMFYPCHPSNIDSELKEYINNGLANLFVLDTVDICYYRYYFFLFLIKTEFEKKNNHTKLEAVEKIKNLPSPYNDPDQLTMAVGRQWHYRYEINRYIDQQPILPFRDSMPEIIDNRIAMGALSANTDCHIRQYNKFHRINSIELYFGNTQQEYEKICAYSNLLPSQSVEHVKSYVRKNINLVEKYSELSFETFLNTDNESIKYLLYNMLEKHHNDEYQNTP
jgi:hypothetical protein